MEEKLIEEGFKKLEEYCRSEGFKGYDPFDGLNSKLFDYLPFLRRNSLFKLIWIQFFKRSPINFRNLLKVEKGYNPKALGLFLSGYTILYKIEKKDEYLAHISFFTEKLIELKAEGWKGNCWGYNFDWQARAFFQPKNTPTVVATTFISNALLDAYEITGDEQNCTGRQ